MLARALVRPHPRHGIGRGLAWTVAGGALGLGVYLLLERLLLVLPAGVQRPVDDGLMLLGSPLARVYSFVTATPLQHEWAMFVYWLAIPATFVLVGAIGGWVVPRTRW